MIALFICKKRAKEKNPQKNEDFLFLTLFRGFLKKRSQTGAHQVETDVQKYTYSCKNARLGTTSIPQ